MSNDEILDEFVLETHENLSLLDSDLIALEKNPAEKSTLAQVFRTLHSIKGTAGFMGLVKLQNVAHSAESLLSKLRAGELRFNAPIATALLNVVDAVREMLGCIEASGDEGSGDYSALIAEVDRLRESGGETETSSPADATAIVDPLRAAETPASAEPIQLSENLSDEPPSPAFGADQTLAGEPLSASAPASVSETAATQVGGPIALSVNDPDASQTAGDPPRAGRGDPEMTQVGGPVALSVREPAGGYESETFAAPIQLSINEPNEVGAPASDASHAASSNDPAECDGFDLAEDVAEDSPFGEAAPFSEPAGPSPDEPSRTRTVETPPPPSPKRTAPPAAASSESLSESAATRIVAPFVPPSLAAPVKLASSPAASVPPPVSAPPTASAPPAASSPSAASSPPTGSAPSVKPSAASAKVETPPRVEAVPIAAAGSSVAPRPSSVGASLAPAASAPSSMTLSLSPEALPSESSEPRQSSAVDASIRVDVGLLDKLMTLVGELVLARNQILQYSDAHEDGGYLGAVQRLNLLTTELQAGVMKTRMQPIGNVLNKFPRIVRDLAIACGKKIRFEMDGQETELDKTLVEAIRDPLTHMVRNAVDHGIEPPSARLACGKPEEGRLRMVAYHEGGKVIIEVTDDGRGIDANRVRDKALHANLVTAEVAARMSRQELLRLIFLPGFSTAEAVTQFSGRGVGMDVVRTNIEKIGGTVDIESTPGQGTTIRTKIPLTLAIIPALIVVSGGERYAIPQVSLLEVVRLDPTQVQRGVEHIYNAPVYRLRGELLPLVFLDAQLGLAQQSDATRDLNIVVLQTDDRSFGVVVDAIRDTEEVVVKPLQKPLKGICVFAGAAIMGDGRVALVIDVLGLAQRANVLSGVKSLSLTDHESSKKALAHEPDPLLLFAAEGAGQLAIPLSCVARLEEFPGSVIETLGARLVVQYRGEILPLIDVAQELAAMQRGASHSASASRVNLRDADESEAISVIVYSEGDKPVGLIVGKILDIVYEHIAAGTRATRPGVLFTAIVRERVTEFLDVAALIRDSAPQLLSAAR